MSEFAELGSLVAERLPGWCKHDDSLIRCMAVEGVRRLNVKNSLAAETLKDLLLDADPDVRIDAAFVLGELEVHSSSGKLLDIITGDPVGETRVQATKALAKLGSDTVIDQLIECIRNDGYPELEAYTDEAETNPCWQVQSEAIVALGEIASKEVVEPLINFIDECEYGDIQDLGFRTLAKVDAGRAYQYLHQQLEQGNDSTRRRILRALADNCVDSPDPSNALITNLTRSLEDSDPDVRIDSARLLAHFESPQADQALCQLLHDPEKSVCNRAAEILAQTKRPATLELLHAMLENALAGKRQLVASILGQTGNSESARIMSALVASSEGELRQELVRSIGLTGDTEVLPILLGLIDAESQENDKAQVIAAISQVLSRHGQDTGPELQEKLQETLNSLIFDADRLIGTAALEALVRTHEKPDDLLMEFIQLEVVADNDLKDTSNQIPVTDISPQAEAFDPDEETLHHENAEAGDEKAMEELTPLDDFINELPGGGDPSSSTLASILSRYETEPVEEQEEEVISQSAETPVNSVQWIPAHAVRLLIAYSDLDDELIEGLLDISNDVGEALLPDIIEVFSRSGNPAVQAFLEQCLERENQHIVLAALHALKEFALPITDKGRVETLLNSESPLIRQKSVELLAANDEALSQQFLKEAFADNDREVCISAMQSIRKETFNGELRETLFDLLMQSGGDLTIPVASVLRRMEDSDSIHWLLEKVADEDLREFHWIFINTLTETFTQQRLSRE